MAQDIIITADQQGNFSLPDLTRANIAQIDIVDVDLVVTAKSGERYLLPNAGINAMGDYPPVISFAGDAISSSDILSQTGVVFNIEADNFVPTTEKPEEITSELTPEEIKKLEEALEEKEQQQEELEEALAKMQKDLQEAAEEKQELQAQREKDYDKRHENDSQSSSLTQNTEASIEKMVEAAKKIQENLHTSDYDYNPPAQFKPLPIPSVPSGGVPPPISLMPIVTITIGNVDGTTIDGANIYGGGGALGTGADARLGASNPLQFSAATIDGTDGNDVIYTDGPLLGNDNPSVSRDFSAKEIMLNVAGYFTTLNDIKITGVPETVVIEGGTDQGQGNWSLPGTISAPFRIIYDINAWRDGEDTFELTFQVSGETTRGVAFDTSQTFRFMYMDVTDVSQITDKRLVYEDNGQLKQIYVLPTMGQPSIINAGEGDDIIHGGLGQDTITSGNGNNHIYAYGGDDIIVTGNGNNTVDLGQGNNTLTTGTGADTITAGDGNNIIAAGGGGDTVIVGNGNNLLQSGLGTNSFTVGTGVNRIDYSTVTTTAITLSLVSGTALGTGLDDTFTGNMQNAIGTGLGDHMTGSTGNNVLYGGDGDDTIIGNGGNDTIYGDGGNDTLTGGIGDDIIYGGDGDNTIYGGSAGIDFLYGGSGNNIFISEHAGVTYNGTNGALILSGIYNTVDYSAANGAMTINLANGTGLGNLAQGDVYELVGSTGYNTINKIIGGSGNDRITGSNSDDWLIGGGGDDSLIGGAGNNILDAGGNYNYYYGGIGNDTMIVRSSQNELRYEQTTAGLVVNFDSVSRSFTNSLGNLITVDANSGSNKGVTAADALSFSNGDTYTFDVGGNFTLLYGSSHGDVIFGNTLNRNYYLGGGNDYFYGGTGSDRIFVSGGTDYLDGGGGLDVLNGNPNPRYNSSATAFMYLDGNYDLNTNGTADYIERGFSSLTAGGVTYTGFVTGRGQTLVRNFEDLMGGGLNDTLVGNAGSNMLWGGGGTNIMHGLAGNDTIHMAFGSNTVDGGDDTDTVNFSGVSSYTSDTSGVQSAYVFLSDASFFGSSDKAFYWAGTANSAYQARIGTSTYSTITNVENITGSLRDDVLYGNSGANTIMGGSGNDVIAGNGGADSLYGEGGNDTFLVTAANLAATTLFHGGANTDTVKVTGLTTFAAGSITGAKFNSIEVYDVRNGVGMNTYSFSANDITGLADAGTASSVTLRLDSGDFFTPTVGAGTGAVSYLQVSSTATNTIYHYFSDVGQTTRVAAVDVYTGTA